MIFLLRLIFGSIFTIWFHMIVDLKAFKRMQPPFCRSICRRRLNYVRYEKHCPTFPPMSIKILQSILREELVVCVKHANFIENLLLSCFHIQCKNETPRSFVCIYSQLERRGKRERNKQTEKHEVCKGYKICFCVFSTVISFLTFRRF